MKRYSALNRFRLPIGVVFVVIAALSLFVLIRGCRHSLKVEQILGHTSGAQAILEGTRGRLLAVKLENELPQTLGPLAIPTAVRYIGATVKTALFCCNPGEVCGPPQAWFLINDFPEMKYLQFQRAMLRGSDSKVLAEMTQLRTLDLRDGNVTNTVLADIQNLQHLEELRLSGEMITSQGIELLTGHSKLAILGLSHTGIDNACFAPLRTLTSLSVLDIDHNNITDIDPTRLSSLVNLTNLSMGSTFVSEATFRDIDQLQHLIAIDLSNTRVGNGIVSTLCRCKSLEAVFLSDNNISDSAFDQFDGKCNWVTLMLDRTDISDASIPMLVRIRSLRFLSLVGTKVTLSGCNELRRQLPGCRVANATN